MIDPTDAPEGYVAELATMLCGRCKFFKHGCRNDEARCCAGQRADQTHVIFRKKESPDGQES